MYIFGQLTDCRGEESKRSIKPHSYRAYCPLTVNHLRQNNLLTIPSEVIWNFLNTIYLALTKGRSDLHPQSLNTSVYAVFSPVIASGSRASEGSRASCTKLHSAIQVQPLQVSPPLLYVFFTTSECQIRCTFLHKLTASAEVLSIQSLHHISINLSNLGSLGSR